MKAIQIDNTGGPEVLQLVEKEVPSVSENEVLVRVKAAGINFADIMQRAGSYPMPIELPITPGFEIVGLVEETGANVTTTKVGDRVAALLPTPGGYAEYVVVDSSQLIPLPDFIEFAQATALLSQGLTAYFLLDQTARLQAQQTVLVHTAAGGVGSMLVQIAKIKEATVIATASTDEKLQLAKELGADVAINYARKGWADQVQKATQDQGVDIILDAIGGEIGQKSLSILAPYGQWIVYGALSSEGNGLSSEEVFRMIFNNQSLQGFSIYGFQDQIPSALAQMFDWVKAEKLTAIAQHQFPLSEAAQAHQAIELRKTTGKVVLAVGS